MAYESPFLLTKQLEADVSRLLSLVDATDLSIQEQQTYRELKHGLVDARLEIQDYELAETREHQLKNAKEAHGFLEVIQGIIAGNTINVFGAVDVAHLTAKIEHIRSKLV